jgi:hypothetical protein
MRICPQCGYENPMTAFRCAGCHEPLPPVSLFTRALPTIDAALGRVGALFLFLLGVGLDVAVGFVIAAVTPLVGNELWFLLVGMVLLGVLFVIPKKTRIFGYGLLAGSFSAFVWMQSACTPTLYFR